MLIYIGYKHCIYVHMKMLKCELSPVILGYFSDDQANLTWTATCRVYVHTYKNIK